MESGYAKNNRNKYVNSYVPKNDTEMKKRTQREGRRTPTIQDRSNKRIAENNRIKNLKDEHPAYKQKVVKETFKETKDYPLIKPNLPKSVKSFYELIDKANRYERETNMSRGDKQHNRFVSRNVSDPDRVDSRIDMNVNESNNNESLGPPRSRKLRHMYTEDVPVKKPNLPKSITHKSMKSFEVLIKKSYATKVPKLIIEKGKIYDPAGLAAAIGMKKYGKKRFEEMAHKKHKKSNKPGGGGRFKKLEHELEEE